MMDILLIVLAGVFIIVGLIGCILPIIPGPPLSYVGLLILEITEKVDFTTDFLLLMFFFAIVVTILDYLVPVMWTKKFGGTKIGVIGSALGLIVGVFFFPPMGIIFGPFVGAVIGELLNESDFNQAVKSGIGSFIGFLIGTGVKLIVSSVMTYYYFKEVFV